MDWKEFSHYTTWALAVLGLMISLVFSYVYRQHVWKFNHGDYFDSTEAFCLWCLHRPPMVQNQILGKERAELLRKDYNAFLRSEKLKHLEAQNDPDIQRGES